MSSETFVSIRVNEGFTSLFLMDLNTKWGLVIFTNADQADDFGFDLFKYFEPGKLELEILKILNFHFRIRAVIRKSFSWINITYLQTVANGLNPQI